MTIKLEEEDIDVLVFWKKHQERMPLRARLFRRIGSAQASSGQSERTYSDCGLTVSERRANLDPGTVENIELINMAYQAGFYQ